MSVRHKKILVLDSDSQAIEKLHSLFIREGYSITTYRNFTEAVYEVNNTRFDCVIMDVQLEEMEGYKAVPILKAIDPKLPVIITAAQNTRELEIKVRQQDIFYYYIKSFDIEELKLAVRSAKRETEKETKKESLPKVLIIDDDQDFIRSIENILEERQAYDVYFAFDKDQAIASIETQKPDLILLDIMMEKYDNGFTLFSNLKRNPEYQKIPILFTTAMNEEEISYILSTKGFKNFLPEGYLFKPIKAAELLCEVEKFTK